MSKIAIEGVPNAKRKINSLEDISDILRKPMNKSLLRLANRMAVYPPPPPGSTYRRTGTLGRRWTTAQRKVTTATRTRIVGEKGNNTKYGPRVQSEEWQAKVHQNRWRTAEDVATSEERWIIEQFEQSLQDRVDE